MSARVKIVTNNAAAARANVQQGLRGAITKATFAVEADAKTRAPVDTGALRTSIQGSVEADGARGVVAVGVEYGPHVEFGTRYQGAQPFLLPALHAVTPQLAAELRRLGSRLT